MNCVFALEPLKEQDVDFLIDDDYSTSDYELLR